MSVKQIMGVRCKAWFTEKTPTWSEESPSPGHRSCRKANRLPAFAATTSGHRSPETRRNARTAVPPGGIRQSFAGVKTGTTRTKRHDSLRTLAIRKESKNRQGTGAGNATGNCRNRPGRRWRCHDAMRAFRRFSLSADSAGKSTARPLCRHDSESDRPIRCGANPTGLKR